MESQWNHRGPEASYTDRCWWWGLGDDSSRWHDSWTSAGRPSDAATILIFQCILVQPPLKRFNRDLFPHRTLLVFLWFPLISCIVVVFLSSSFDSWVPRHRDSGLFGGCVFVQLSGHVANATAPQASFLIGISPFGEGWLSGKRNNHKALVMLDEVAHCHMNFADRAQRDNQMDWFKVLPLCCTMRGLRGVFFTSATFQSTNFPHSTQCCSGLRHHAEGNDLLYSVIHAACCT